MEEKKRGKKLGTNTKKVCDFLGVKYDVFRGSILKRVMYYQAKRRIFEELGYETKLQKNVDLKVKVDGKFRPVNKVYMRYKLRDRRLSPVNTVPKFHNNTASYEDRNSFSDFVINYVNGEITYKKLFSIAKKMFPVVVR